MVTIDIEYSSPRPLNPPHPFHPNASVVQVTQQVAAVALSSPSSLRSQPIVKSKKPPRIDDEEDWDAFYPPIPEDLDIGAKPWLPAAHRSYHLINATLIDPKNSKEIPGMTLELKGGKIAAVRASKKEDRWEAESEGSIVVDCNGIFLCPGLIDCHVHTLSTPGTASHVETLKFVAKDSLHLRATHVLKGFLSRGFTTVRDVGGATKGIADATEQFLISGPRIFQGGAVMSQTGGHADFGDPNGIPGTCGGGQTYPGRDGCTVDGVTECLIMARDHMRKGADHIKICTSGGVGSVTDKLEGIQFTVEEIQAISTTVRQMGGRLVTAHCYTSEGIRHSILGEVGGIEHGDLLDVPTAKLMAEKGIYLTPTLAVHEIVATPAFSKFMLPSQLAKNEIVRKAGLQAIQYAEEAGVTVCFGTDMLGAMGPFQTAEFVTRAKVLPSPTILKHATSNAAEMLGFPDTLGTILKVGAFADIIFLRSSPLKDITVLSKPRKELLAIMKDGRVVRSRVPGLEVEIPI